MVRITLFWLWHSPMKLRIFKKDIQHWFKLGMSVSNSVRETFQSKTVLWSQSQRVKVKVNRFPLALWLAVYLV